MADAPRPSEAIRRPSGQEEPHRELEHVSMVFAARQTPQSPAWGGRDALQLASKDITVHFPMPPSPHPRLPFHLSRPASDGRLAWISSRSNGEGRWGAIIAKAAAESISRTLMIIHVGVAPERRRRVLNRIVRIPGTCRLKSEKSCMTTARIS